MTIPPANAASTWPAAASSASSRCTTPCATCGQSPCACAATSGNGSTTANDSATAAAKSDTYTPSSPNGDTNPSTSAIDATRSTTRQGKPLNDDQQKEVEALKSRDAHVRAHEAAHLAAAGGFARGGPSFTFQTGPDGKQYAIGGEVNVDVAGVPGDPAATIRTMQTIRRAAFAPDDPSGQDRSVAAQAAATEQQAQAQLAKTTSTTGGKRTPPSVNDVGQKLDVAA